MLYRILTSYFYTDQEANYAQGMNFIAATLLYHLKDEETAFWALFQVLEDKNW